MEEVIERIRKLLALAENNDNEHQAAAAIAKAMELMEKYSINQHQLSGRRDDRGRNSIEGGLYGWQRQLWASVAGMNFCLYQYKPGMRKGEKYQHIVIGRHVNVVSTQVMAEYLQQAVERLGREYAKEHGINIFAKDAIMYREGVALRVAARLRDLKRERSQARNDADRNALTVIGSEEDDLNNDFVKGWAPGTTKANRERNEAWYAEHQQKAREWQAAHEKRMEEDAEYRANYEKVERAAAEEEERRRAEYQKKEAAKARRAEAYYKKHGRYPGENRPLSEKEKRYNSDAFVAGYRDGGDVNLNDQLGANSSKRIG